MVARYDGRCARCRKPIKVTQRIVWFEGEPHRTRHDVCPDAVTEPERIDFTSFLPVSYTRVPGTGAGWTLYRDGTVETWTEGSPA